MHSRRGSGVVVEVEWSISLPCTAAQGVPGRSGPLPCTHAQGVPGGSDPGCCCGRRLVLRHGLAAV